ncbi:MAG: anthranilate synthase component I family protein [Salibacteraceae bacterium]
MKRIWEKFSFSETSKPQLKQWAQTHNPCTILDSFSDNNLDYPNGFTYELVIGTGKVNELTSNHNSFESLKEFHCQNPDWMMGYLSYDLKNELEKLKSENEDHHQVPHLHFFIPETVILITGNELKIGCINLNPGAVWNEIRATKNVKLRPHQKIDLHPRIHHAEYIRGVKSLKHHIQMGDIYEANFCQEFFAENIQIEPFNLYQSLVNTSPTPFSVYGNWGETFLMSASPERYIKKTGNSILSQPIKGTAKRGTTTEEDAQLKTDLYHSKKDRAENVMIVDLVRNDLSITAAQQSVKVDELFGVYSFSNVHQMISTISSRVKEGVHFTDVIKKSFPMGSMTGAPKIMAMNLIEEFEHTQRGIYSGSVGYITPEGDFDFNVIIRSLQYNAANKYLSYMVGGAITDNSDPEGEYHECEVKAASIKKVLKGV